MEHAFIITPDHPKFWTTGRWAHARWASLAQLVLEFGLFITSAVSFWYFGLVFSLFGMIAAANTTGACCCRNDAGKPVAVTHICCAVIALIGSLVDLVLLGAIKAVCDGGSTNNDDRTVAEKFCTSIDGLFALEILCLIVRIITIVTAARVCCFRPQDWQTAISAPATVATVVHPPISAPTVTTATK